MMKNRLIPLTLAIIITLVALFVFNSPKIEEVQQESNNRVSDVDYDPNINPSKFTTNISNKYFKVTPGQKFVYESKTGEGLEKVVVSVSSEKKQVMGVSVLVLRDIVTLDGEIIEDTRDWYAQDSEGNIWYFGEEVDNYEDGRLKDHNGSWEAGKDGAKPGIVMLANPEVGKTYRQEFLKGEAEDMADVLALDKKVVVPFGTFENCLQTRDWSQIDSSLNEYKYYCPEVGFVTLEENLVNIEERVELLNVTTK